MIGCYYKLYHEVYMLTLFLSTADTIIFRHINRKNIKPNILNKDVYIVPK
jgi:hypothetical protein